MSENPVPLKPSKTAELFGLPKWYVPAFGYLVTAVFALIALGGSVRIMNAGLACPDWPLCFGNVIPDYHPQVYFEFIHRVVAGFVSIATVSLMVILFRSKAPKNFKWLGGIALAWLAIQVIFGGLTVLLQLHSKVVAGHLALGTGFFAILLWMYLTLKGEPALPVSSNVRWWSRFLGAAVYGQIILGGLVASHFASLVCTDFPKCQGEWFPTFSGIIGLHLIHRLGAYTIAAFGIANFIVLRRSGIPRLRRLGTGTLAMIMTQIAVGIANVLLFTPPLIAVLHLATGTAILSMMVRQVRLTRAA
jgi:cytochrome c oxidase assembly protein subunit 15